MKVSSMHASLGPNFEWKIAYTCHEWFVVVGPSIVERWSPNDCLGERLATWRKLWHQRWQMMISPARSGEVHADRPNHASDGVCWLQKEHWKASCTYMLIKSEVAVSLMLQGSNQGSDWCDHMLNIKFIPSICIVRTRGVIIRAKVCVFPQLSVTSLCNCLGQWARKQKELDFRGVTSPYVKGTHFRFNLLTLIFCFYQIRNISYNFYSFDFLVFFDQMAFNLTSPMNDMWKSMEFLDHVIKKYKPIKMLDIIIDEKFDAILMIIIDLHPNDVVPDAASDVCWGIL